MLPAWPCSDSFHSQYRMVSSDGRPAEAGNRLTSRGERARGNGVRRRTATGGALYGSTRRVHPRERSNCEHCAVYGRAVLGAAIVIRRSATAQSASWGHSAPQIPGKPAVEDKNGRVQFWIVLVWGAPTWLLRRELLEAAALRCNPARGGSSPPPARQSSRSRASIGR